MQFWLIPMSLLAPLLPWKFVAPFFALRPVCIGSHTRAKLIATAASLLEFILRLY